MPRTDIVATKLSPGQTCADVAESSVAIDAVNQMRVVTSSKDRKVALRITNTHGAGHAVVVVGGTAVQDPTGPYGAPGPGGSAPAQPDYTSAVIPATVGVRWFTVGGQYYRGDGSFWLNFDSLHAGQIAACELP